MNLPNHPQRGGSTESSLTLQQAVLMLGLFGFLAVSLQAAQPAWWNATGAVNPMGTTNDYRVAVQGQLKQFTEKAILYLDTNLSGGAGSSNLSLISGWSNSYYTNGYTTNNPAPADLKVVNQGQLKYIANMIYPRLSAAGFMSTNYPAWSQGTNDGDYKAANIGQLKKVFDFELSAPQAPTNFAAVLNTAQATLNWVSGLNVQSFTVQGSTDGGVTWTNLKTVDGALNAATVTGLDPTLTQSFRVVAHNVAGDSAPSAVMTVVPIVASILSPYPDSTNYTGSEVGFIIQVASTPGTVQQVSYYADSTSLGATTTAPYFCEVPALPAGSHVLKAVVLNSLGNTLELTRSVTCIGVDSDADGLSDDWEMQYFHSLAYGAGDVDGAGRTYLYDYQNGIDPTDFYAGLPPTLTPVQGTNQVGWLGRYLDQPLQVKVMNGATALTNAPVQFAVTAGGGILATRLDQPQGENQNVVTDTNGLATVYYYQAASLTAPGTVAVTANTNSVPYTFTIAVPDEGVASPTNTPPQPPGVGLPPPPGLPTDGSVALYSETVQTNLAKVGFPTYTVTTPPQLYLTQTRWDQQSNPQYWIPIAGNEVSRWNAVAGTVSSYSSPLVPDMYVGVISGVKTTATTSYTWDTDGGFDSYSSTLADPYTTPLLQQLVAGHLPAFTGNMTTNEATASYEMATDESSLAQRNLQYSFESTSNTPKTLAWFICFQPDNTNNAPSVKLMSWTGAPSDFGKRLVDLTTQTYDTGTPVSTNGTASVIPVQFRLLNGDTNAGDVDGMDFRGNRPRTISETSFYVTEAVWKKDIGNTTSYGNDAKDILGVDTPLGSGRPGMLSGQCFIDSLMMLAKVSPAPASVTYNWGRVYQAGDVTISHTSTNTWFVSAVVGLPTGVPNPQFDTYQTPGVSDGFDTTIPSTNGNVVSLYDNPGMYIPNYSNASHTNDYAYHKFAFTYSLTNSAGSTTTVATQQVGQIMAIRRIATTGITANDWTNVINSFSTTNIPSPYFTTNEIKAIVSPNTDQIIFSTNVLVNP